MKKMSIASTVLIVMLSLICMVCIYLLSEDRECRTENELLQAEVDSLKTIIQKLTKEDSVLSYPGFK